MRFPITPLRAAMISLPVVALTLAATPRAQAQTTAYTNQATFLSNVQPDYYTESFNQGSVTNAAAYTFLTNGYGYTVTAGTGNVRLTGDEIRTTAANQTLTFTFTTGNVTAIGGNFYNVTGNLTNTFSSSLVDVTVTFADGTNFSPNAFTPASENAFRGITSNKIISSLVFSAPGASTYASVDNFTAGAASVAGAAAPEPGAFALLGAGVLPLVGLVTRRRCNPRKS